MTSTLVVLRHAKSAYPLGVDDHDRPLSPRGLRDAPVAGELVSLHLPDPQLVLVSTALRAQQTWLGAAAALDPGEVRDVADLYLASSEQMLDAVRAVTADTLIVVAHNPGSELLAERLTANRESEAYRRMTVKFPTAAFAVLTSDLPFGQWGWGSAQLVAFEVGRG